MLKALSTKDDVHFPVTTDLFLEILVLDTEARGYWFVNCHACGATVPCTGSTINNLEKKKKIIIPALLSKSQCPRAPAETKD